MVERRHIVIAGTGRAGTTFLVQLLTKLGKATGFDDSNMFLFEPAMAGLEFDVEAEDAPYIVKWPLFSRNCHEVLLNGKVEIEHVVIPYRNIDDAVASRKRVEEIFHGGAIYTGIAGGLTGTNDINKQKEVLLMDFYNLITTISDFGIPFTMVQFPRSVMDPSYLFGTIANVFSLDDKEEFLSVFHDIVRLEWVHRFDHAET